MNDFTVAPANKEITVLFHGTPLTVITTEAGLRLVAMRPICDAIGLQWEAQLKRIRRTEVLNSTVSMMDMVAADGKSRQLLCLPLDYLNGWLFGIEVNRAKPEIRERLKEYQRECYQALHAYWNDGMAINPRTAYAVNPGDKLTAEEAETLRLMLKSAVDRQPKEKQGALMMQGWSKLKAHFKVGYREIPRHEFSEAVSIIARHTAEWEVVDEAKKPAKEETLQQTVTRWVELIERTKGYPVAYILIFQPLMDAINRKMNKSTQPLPGLKLSVCPPAIGQYRYNPANPHPANGRTIEVAKSIAADIRNWSNNLPAGPARHDLHDAAQTLYDLLVSGWTEVDEALGQIHTAMHYLNRWQGRGGSVGNCR